MEGKRFKLVADGGGNIFIPSGNFCDGCTFLVETHHRCALINHDISCPNPVSMEDTNEG